MVPDFFHLWMMEATVLFLVASMLQKCLCTFPRSLPRYNSVSEVYRQLFGLHGLVCALTYTVNCGTLCRQVCAFPNHVQSTEFTTGGLQSSCRNISRMISGNRMHLSSILSVMAKSVNIYVHVYFFHKKTNTIFTKKIKQKNVFPWINLCT